jgi:hypothetical protein
MLIKSLDVKVGPNNISNLVTGLTLFESIEGFVQGNIQINDGINWYDQVIGANDGLLPIDITFTYLGIECQNTFWMNGITDMKVEKSNKEYVIHLISITEQALKIVDINNVYSGTSHHIIKSIWATVFDSSKSLRAFSPAISGGKYIVPNIKAIDAIEKVVNAAVDENNSGFYLFQRVNDSGKTRLSSLGDMYRDFFENTDGSHFKIRNIILDKCDLDNSGFGNLVGTSKNFTVEYNRDWVDKIREGQWGNKINQIELQKTKIKKNSSVEKSEGEITVLKTSGGLYDNTLRPSIAGQGIAVPKIWMYLYTKQYWAIDTDEWRLELIGENKEYMVGKKLGYEATENGLWGIATHRSVSMNNKKFRENNKRLLTNIKLEIKRIKAGIPVIGDYNLRPLFASTTNPADVASVNQKKRLANNFVKVAGLVPIPVVGAGNSIMVEQGGANKSHTISDGRYIIADVNHIFTHKGNGFEYRQDMSLIRERP